MFKIEADKDGKITITKISGPVDRIVDSRDGSLSAGRIKRIIPVQLAVDLEEAESASEERLIRMHSVSGCAACKQWFANAESFAKQGWNVVRIKHDEFEPGKSYPYFEVFVNGLGYLVDGILTLEDLSQIEGETQ